MAVASTRESISAFTALMGHEPVEAARLLHKPYLPDGMSTRPDGSGVDEHTLMVGGYNNPTCYQLSADSPDQARANAGPATDVLSDLPTIKADDVRSFVKTSLDLTMQGGTTSGVVYPLAVCELAKSFRFRNVGGASAGAIAAALTAAAELGRSEQVRRPERPVVEADPTVAPTDSAPGVPVVRRGFVGLTDVIMWLTQTRAGDPTADEFRLFQLFRPAATTQRVFRILVAVMRQRTWPLPVILLMAFGPLTRILASLLILSTVALVGWAGARFAGHPAPWWTTIGWGLLDTAACVAGLVGIVLLVQGILAARSVEVTPPPWLSRLSRVTSGRPTPRRTIVQQLVPGTVGIMVAAVVAGLRTSQFLASVVVVLAGSLVLAALLTRSAYVYLSQFSTHAYGLVGGSAPRRPASLLDKLAGAPNPTVEHAVIPWLHGCLNQLAGVPPEEVLRFGHLWAGADFHELRLQPDPAPAAVAIGADPATAPDPGERWKAMNKVVDHRLVNLELMTTDLTRQRPYRFPLAHVDVDDPAQLWLQVDLLDGPSPVFPAAVLDVLREGTPRVVTDTEGVERTLHPLPPAWDLPVIFAVRLSMALPALFQAIPMFRLVENSAVQDDLGRSIIGTDHQPLEVRGSGRRAERLWFSDGGITSNFPVHFFDSPLPRWPTVSLNLGPYPETAPHQDVWLPQDWDDTTIPVEPLTGSGLSLAGAVLNTAMSWRDSMQSAMPGYRNRIAQVRTRKNEGGTNLFMPREVIASMALRGALAGARLRSRFSDERQWNRFRWLRLRVAMSNLERMRAMARGRRGHYADALSGEAWLDAQKAAFTEGPPDKPLDWYDPVGDFWPKAPRLLNTFADAYRPPVDAPNEMCEGIPRPEPVLRQTPQE